ncbi:MAG TPA: ParB N-terminal domain-containing protein [Tepidimicrobium sp.]|nr:ParB N-terminal domain-containing protein [Tepidimicrobium sp.]
MGKRIKLDYVPIDSLKPFAGNPRKLTEQGLEKIKRSIEEFDFINPVLAQQGTNMIIAGHQRIKAARAVGLTEVPVIWLDMDDTTAKAYNIADNRLQDEAEWDKHLLGDVFQDIDTGELDLTVTGFDPDEISSLLAADYGPIDLEAYLDELDMSEAIDKPIWATIRTKAENQEVLERVFAVLEQNGIRVERSYDTGA